MLMSKNHSDTFIRARPQEVTFYTVGNAEPLEIIVEISSNNDGGLFCWPMLSNYEQYQTVFVVKEWYGGIFPIMFFSAALIIILMVLILNFIKINRKIDVPIILYMLALMVHYIFTVEVAEQLFALFSNVNYYYSHYFSYITGIVLWAAFVLVLKKYNIMKSNKLVDGIIIGVNLLVMITFYLLAGYMIRYWLLLIPAASMLYYIYYICKAAAESVKFAPILIIQSIFIFMVLIMEATDNNGVFLIGGGGVYSTAFSIILILVLWVYVLQIKDTINNSRNAERLEKEISEVKNRALKAQIKPHFMFNVLTSVQDIYHNNLEEGDNALAKFCKHLRLNVDSEYKDMVSFNEELS
ncbi:MAG: histidine kinase, partial [Clostridia bacterium]|nr:histidine kinase [Clostridia bacterium]